MEALLRVTNNNPEMDVTKLSHEAEAEVEESSTCSNSSSLCMGGGENIEDDYNDSEEDEDEDGSVIDSDCDSVLGDDDSDYSDDETEFEIDADLEEQLKVLTDRAGGLFRQNSCPNLMKYAAGVSSSAMKNLSVKDYSNDDDDDSCSDDDSDSDYSDCDEMGEPNEKRPSMTKMFRRMSESDLIEHTRLSLTSDIVNNDEAISNFFKSKQPLTIIQSTDHQTTKTAVNSTNPTTNTCMTNTNPTTRRISLIARKPLDVLLELLDLDRVAYPANMWDAYFMGFDKKNVAAHTKAMELTIRKEDYGELRSMLQNGQTLQSCNTHGESTIHLACRRASVKLLRFLMTEGNVTVRIRDDMGRTPLHDTCWSYNDRFDIFKTLLEDSPELLFIRDFRGFCPFDYIPKQRWNEWCTFLEANRDFIKDATKGVNMTDMEAALKKMERRNPRASVCRVYVP